MYFGQADIYQSRKEKWSCFVLLWQTVVQSKVRLGLKIRSSQLKFQSFLHVLQSSSLHAVTQKWRKICCIVHLLNCNIIALLHFLCNLQGDLLNKQYYLFAYKCFLEYSPSYSQIQTNN